MANPFPILTSKPSKSDKYIYLYNNAFRGGKSRCITGKPTDSTCNVLCNCVGWACARFNHIYNLLTGYNGIKYPNFCVNAENFIEIAKQYGLSTGLTPKPGAIMVWQKGATLGKADGAGHVAVVEQVMSSTQVRTSESGYNSFAFRNRIRTKGSDGNWGTAGKYHFRGFIYNPAVKETITESANKTTIVAAVARNTKVNQIQVLTKNLRVRDDSGNVLGYAKEGYYNYSTHENFGGYERYKIGTNNWIAYDTKWAKILPADSTITIGCQVKVAKNAPIYGTSKSFASWIYSTKLYVRSIAGNKVGISTTKDGALTGYVDKKYLTKV